MGLRKAREKPVGVEVRRFVGARVGGEHADEIHSQGEVLERLEDETLRRTTGERARARLYLRAAFADPLHAAKAVQHRLEAIGLVELPVWVGVPVRARARAQPDGMPAAVEEAARNGGVQLSAVLVAHYGRRRNPVDCGGDSARQLAHDAARIIIPTCAHGRIRTDCPSQLRALPDLPVGTGETGKASVAKTSGQIVVGLQEGRAVAVGEIVIHPHGTRPPCRMHLGHADKVGDEFRIARTGKALGRQTVCRDHRPPVLARAVARLEDGVGMPDDRLYLDGWDDAHSSQVIRRHRTLPCMFLVPGERRKAHASGEPYFVERLTVLLQRHAHFRPFVWLRETVAEAQRAERRRGRAQGHGCENRRDTHDATEKQSFRHLELNHSTALTSEHF